MELSPSCARCGASGSLVVVGCVVAAGLGYMAHQRRRPPTGHRLDASDARHAELADARGEPRSARNARVARGAAGGPDDGPTRRERDRPRDGHPREQLYIARAVHVRTAGRGANYRDTRSMSRSAVTEPYQLAIQAASALPIITIDARAPPGPRRQSSEKRREGHEGKADEPTVAGGQFVVRRSARSTPRDRGRSPKGDRRGGRTRTGRLRVRAHGRRSRR